jgi:uncharacterized membrane protein HdeD (DUF308 family)
MDKEKLGKTVDWGVGAVNIVMGSKIVTIGCFLYTGINNIINPRGGLRFTALMLAGFVALYALVSIIFVLTNKNEKVSQGKEMVGDMVKGVVDGYKNPLTQGKELASKSKVISGRKKDSDNKFGNSIKKLSERQKKEIKAGKAVLIIIYSLLFVGAGVLFFWPEATVTLVHIIIGALLIADGFSSLAASVAAVRNGIPLKDKLLSLIVCAFSFIIGLAFILMAWNTAEFTMRLGGIVLLIKGLVDLFIMIRNRELISTAAKTISDIKYQGDKESDEQPGEETNDFKNIT